MRLASLIRDSITTNSMMRQAWSSPASNPAKGKRMRTIEVVVKLEIDENADIQEVVAEMNYTFSHPAIKSTEIVDLITEL
jgi:hypothetical protein